MNYRRSRDTLLKEQEIECLKIIQGVIGRMADNSQKLKTWYLSLCAVCGALLGKDFSFTALSLVCFIAVTVVFWSMDAKYLQLERKFRRHYSATINGAVPYLETFLMNVNRYDDEVESVPSIMLKNFSVRFYPAFIVIACIMFLVS